MTLSNEWELFVLYNYPQGHKRRRADKWTEILTGDPLRKPWPDEWKGRVEEKSIVPTAVKIPAELVVMPFVAGVNMYDAFAHRSTVKDWGKFSNVVKKAEEAPADMLSDISFSLAVLHQMGITWGEAILQNVICTENAFPVWVDAEMRYQGLSLVQQKAMDVRNLTLSATGVVAERAAHRELVRAIVEPHPVGVLGALQDLSAQCLPCRQRYVFERFGKYRIGARGYEHFEETRNSVRVVLADVLGRWH